MDKDPCEICREQAILELFARIGGRTLVQKDCEYCNVRSETGTPPEWVDRGWAVKGGGKDG